MNSNLSAKNKIIIVSIGWLVINLVMFLFLFKIMDGKNKESLEDMAQDRLTLVTLQAQTKSFRQAETDLEKMSKMELQPKDFFSKDITLVQEIQVLENLNGKYNTKVSFSGVSGVVEKGQGQQAGTLSSMVYVPYTLSITGGLADVENLLEVFENLSFITKINSIALSSSGEGKVTLNIGSGFYVKNN